MEQLIECLEAELSDRLSFFVSVRHEVAHLQAERDTMCRGLTLAEELCDAHMRTQHALHGQGTTGGTSGSACVAEVLQLLSPEEPEEAAADEYDLLGEGVAAQ